MESKLELIALVSSPQLNIYEEPMHIFCDGIYGQNNRNSTFDNSFILYIGCIIPRKLIQKISGYGGTSFWQ